MSSQFVVTSSCLVTDPNNVSFSSRLYWLATVSHLTHGSKCPHILDWLPRLATNWLSPTLTLAMAQRFYIAGFQPSCHRSVVQSICVGFQFLTAVLMKNPIFWDITPCSPLKISRRFGETCRFHLQDRRLSQARNQHEVHVGSSACGHCLHSAITKNTDEELQFSGIYLRVVHKESTDVSEEYVASIYMV
jgi:hypothetical protein